MPMKPPELDPGIVLELDPIDRWNVFSRLQELSIDCDCHCGTPLQVAVHTPTAAVQVWSVIRRMTAPRDVAIASLENCWNQVAYR